MADSDGADSEQSTEQLLRELQSRIDTLEDQVMMERLEDLSLEDEIEVVEDLLDRDEEAIQEKLEMLDRIEEEYEETQVGEKLQYLYQQLTDVQDRLDEVAGQQVDEEEVSELRGRIDRLESEVASTGDEEQNFDDVYDKLYTLRDRLNEVKEQVEEGAELSDAERDALIREIEGRVEGGGGPSVAEVKRQVLDEIDVSSTGASVEDIREQVLDGITAEDVSQAALEDMQDEIDKLRGRLDAQEDIGGGDGGASGELRSRVAELEGKVEELEQRSGGSTDAPESAGPAEVEGLRDELDELREEVAEAAKQDIEDEIAALRDDMEDIRAEMEGGGVSPGDIAALEEKVEELDDRLPSDELLESVEYVDEEFRGEVAELRERVETVQDALEEDVEALREELEPLRERVAALEGAEMDEMQERIDELDARADDIEDRLELDARELLEALEYEGEELEDRFKEILVQIEHLREEIGKQEERINSLSHAQNIFESNIGQVMREQRDLTEKLQEEDRKLERKTDLLFETIEEGLAMEEDEFEERLAQQEQRIAEQEDALQRRTAFLLEALEEGLSEEEAEFERRLEAEEAARVFQDQQLADEIAAQISGVEGEIEAGELGREQMAELLQEALEEGIEMESERLEELEAKLQEHGLTIPESLQDELEERSGRTGIGALAEIAAENQRQVQELQEKLEDMEKHAPTIVE